MSRIIRLLYLIRQSTKSAMIILIIMLFFTPGFSLDQNRDGAVSVLNVLTYGAVGDGKTLDTKAIQRTIDEANKIGNNTRVLIPESHKFLIGTLELKSAIDFHLQGDAELLLSSNREDYTGRAAIIANGAEHLTVSGTGSVNGHALEFMTHYDKEAEIWRPKKWRPRVFLLTKCIDLTVKNITIKEAPSWSLHMLGCETVLVDGVKIHNNLDVPNCDGINPDHCQNVVIRNCYISCGDDAIVIKTTGQDDDFGPSANIHVYDCILETQDSGVKIGTETTQDIYNIVFEKCEIKNSCRGITIQLRDEGSVYNIVFRDITFKSSYHSAPWWGRGEAISFTAIPRTPETKIGTINNIRVENVNGLAENSIRINGTKESRLSNVYFNNVHVTFNRWTDYPGNLFDNRPTKTYPAIESHNNPGIYIRFSDQIILKNCSVNWGDNIPEYFTNAIYAHDVTDVKIMGFKGQAAHPDRDEAIVVPESDLK